MFLNKFPVTVADKIVGLKSIAAYRSGLEINTRVTIEEAEESFAEVLSSKNNFFFFVCLIDERK